MFFLFKQNIKMIHKSNRIYILKEKKYDVELHFIFKNDRVMFFTTVNSMASHNQEIVYNLLTKKSCLGEILLRYFILTNKKAC